MKANRGFTLIELLVVIAIIGILSSVVLASLNSAREKSRDAKRVSDIRQLTLALELYFDSNGTYPDVLTDLSPGFVPQDPTDPVGGAAYPYNAYTTKASPSVAGDDCDNAEEALDQCIYYHIGANLEQSGHSALSADADHVSDVIDANANQDADGCAAEATRYCYDLVP